MVFINRRTEMLPGHWIIFEPCNFAANSYVRPCVCVWPWMQRAILHQQGQLQQRRPLPLLIFSLSFSLQLVNAYFLIFYHPKKKSSLISQFVSI